MTTNQPVLQGFAGGDARRLHDDLRAAGFEDETIYTRLGIGSVTNLKDVPGEVIMRLTEDGSPLSVLIRLLLLCRAVPPEAAARALPKVGLDRLLAGGVVASTERGIRSNFQFLPFLGLLLAVDKPRQARLAGEQAREDFVMGVGGSTMTLANLTIRRRMASMLDIGSGSGVHTLLGARHADEAHGVDINPRAHAIAMFNAALNGLTNARFHLGNFTDPVADRRFDLVVSNPPYVVSPERKYVYRDSPFPLDGVVPEVVRRGAGLLRDGGYAQVLCNWCNISGQPTPERLARWFAGLSCDAWIHVGQSTSPEQYAHSWITSTGTPDPPALRDAMSRWMSYYREHGVESISFGVLTLRRRPGTPEAPNWVHMDQNPERMSFLGPAWEHVERRMDAQMFLRHTSDERLRATPLRAAPDARIQHELSPSADGTWQVSAARIRLAAGMASSGSLDGVGSRLVTMCDGTRPLGVLVEELAPGVGVSPDELWHAVAPVARRFIENGFLLAGSGAAPA